MEALFSIEALGTLATLIFLQAVLGFDNLLYISIESQRAPADKQSAVRKWASPSPWRCGWCCCSS